MTAQANAVWTSLGLVMIASHHMNVCSVPQARHAENEHPPITFAHTTAHRRHERTRVGFLKLDFLYRLSPTDAAPCAGLIHSSAGSSGPLSQFHTPY